MIVASKNGDENHPAWFLNLRDDPAVGVMMNGETREMTARIANADDRAALSITDSYWESRRTDLRPLSSRLV